MSSRSKKSRSAKSHSKSQSRTVKTPSRTPSRTQSRISSNLMSRYQSQSQCQTSQKKSRKPKSMTQTSVSKRNNRQSSQTKSNKVNKEIKQIENNIKEQSKVREFALQTGNLEVVGYSNKILFVLLLSLLAKKTDESVKLANKYSKQTGLKIPDVNLSTKVPSPRSTVKTIQNTYNAPQSGSIAAGWK